MQSASKKAKNRPIDSTKENLFRFSSEERQHLLKWLPTTCPALEHIALLHLTKIRTTIVDTVRIYDLIRF